ncbi:MAG: hypothetical protein KKG76_02790 [Euryarchaeota archaeon]|nr:hypothetical protein [Euryarchaeota archaeon]MBU4138370.1 hypothetical protein [Euryarchaeota archaeon]
MEIIGREFMILIEKSRKLYILIICVEILLLSNSLLSSGAEASTSWTHPYNNGTECISCHNIDKIELPLPDAIENDLISKDNQISQTGVTGSKASGSEIILMQGGGTDCVSCHDILTGSEIHG